jgi:predicted amidohydrolase YtcJ
MTRVVNAILLLRGMWLRGGDMKSDIVLTGNSVFDSIHDEPFDGFIAISGDSIAAVEVGRNNLSAYVDEHTKIYDFPDKTIMPGFHDSHVHLLLAAIALNSVDLGSASSEEDAAAMTWEYEKTRNSDGWVFGFNWYNFFWNDQSLPTKKTLDRYFPDRPVVLMNSECHGVWVNSKALELCGISKDTQEPEGGIMHRFADGELTGVLDEEAARIVAKVAYDLPLDVQIKYLSAFMKHTASYGITSIVDVQPLFNVEMSLLKSLKYFDEKNELAFRAYIAGDLFVDPDIHDYRRRTYESEMVYFDHLKQFSEGIFPTHTCLLLEEYSDEPGEKGIQLCDFEKIERCVTEANKRGYSVKLHAQADRAIRMCLDIFERSIERNGPCRNLLEHCEVVDRTDRPRFRELEVIPSMQPEHLGLMPTWDGHDYRVTLGDERMWDCWPVKSMLDAAGVLALGTDCPVVSVNPFLQVSRSITRLMDDGKPEGGLNPSERLTIAEALKNYTYGSAYGAGAEGRSGSLSIGKYADIAVIDRNLFSSSPESVRGAKAVMTIVGGRIVHEAPVKDNSCC